MTRKSSRNSILIILIVETITSVRVPRNLNPNLNKIWNAISDNWWARQKIEEQDAWLESSKVAQRKKNSFFSSVEQMVLIGTIWNTWEKPLSLTEPIFLWGSTGPLRISNAIFGCPFFHLQFSTMFNFSLLQIFLFLQNQHGMRVERCSRVFQELGVRFLSAANSPTENL